MKELNCWIISFVDMNKETSSNGLPMNLTPKETRKSPEIPLRTPSCLRTPVNTVAKKQVSLCTPNATKGKIPRGNRPAGILEQMEEYLGITLWTPQKAQQAKATTKTPNGPSSKGRRKDSEARMEQELVEPAMDMQHSHREERAYLEDPAKNFIQTP